MPPLNLYARVRISLCNLHTRPRVQRAPGIPCSLFFSRDNILCKARASVSREHGSLSVSGEALIKLNPAPPCHCELGPALRRRPALDETVRTPVAHARDRWPAMTMYLLPPNLTRNIDRELQFCPLLFLGEDVALFGRGKAALRRQCELVQRRVFGGFLQPPLDVVLLLQFAALGGNDPDHHDLVAFRQEPQRLEAGRALRIVFEEIAVVIGAGQHGLRYRLIAAGGNPGGAEIAAADMRGD